MMAYGYVALAVGLSGLIYFAYRGSRLWLDAAQRDLEPLPRLGWSLWGVITPGHFWWPARIQSMSRLEQAALVAHETAARSGRRPSSLPCPLCGAEVSGAWTLDAEGQAQIAPGPVACPECDFRLDACRHCTEFLPGSPQDWGQSAWRGTEMTWGRCARYKKVQPVEQACGAQMARQLRKRGYDQLRAPALILDSYLPLDSCRAFQADRKRLGANRIAWPDARHRALLGISSSPATGQASPVEGASNNDEQPWLL